MARISVQFSDRDPRKMHEVAKGFFQHMANRLAVGHHRFRRDHNRRLTGKRGWIDRVERNIHEYRKTGNMEKLTDAANYLLLEFAFPDHPTPNWTPRDQGWLVDGNNPNSWWYKHNGD